MHPILLYRFLSLFSTSQVSRKFKESMLRLRTPFTHRDFLAFVRQCASPNMLPGDSWGILGLTLNLLVVNGYSIDSSVHPGKPSQSQRLCHARREKLGFVNCLLGTSPPPDCTGGSNNEIREVLARDWNETPI